MNRSESTNSTEIDLNKQHSPLFIGGVAFSSDKPLSEVYLHQLECGIWIHALACTEYNTQQNHALCVTCCFKATTLSSTCEIYHARARPTDALLRISARPHVPIRCPDVHMYHAHHSSRTPNLHVYTN